MDRDVLPDRLAAPPGPACTCYILLPASQAISSAFLAGSGSPLPLSPPPPHHLIYISLEGGRRLGKEPQVPGEEGDAQDRQDQPKATKIVPRIQPIPVTPSWCSFYCHIYIPGAASETSPLTPTPHSLVHTHTHTHFCPAYGQFSGTSQTPLSERTLQSPCLLGAGGMLTC